MFDLITTNKTAFFLIVIWTLFWKGLALWKSAQANQRNWFIALLVINTFGALELFYLYILPKIKIKNKKEETNI